MSVSAICAKSVMRILVRQRSGSHRIYATPWQGDPRVNLQNDKGMAKVYQVKQVLKAIEKLEVENAKK
jgi:hypothetical protein